MTTRIETISTCDRCDRIERRDGAEGDFPPVRWALFGLSYRAPGGGWSGGGRRVDKTLCPDCAALVEAFALQPEGVTA